MPPAVNQETVRGAARPSGAVAAEGERRQITVMFCDLVGSTEMSARLDLDDLKDRTLDYYSSCCEVIQQADGFIARLVGDGILAYFGYPDAREDAAESAIRAGLGILEALARRAQGDTDRLAVHIGIATGMAVISDMVGSGFAERHAATGLTPNLAARIQALATAGSVLVADETRRLAGGLFVYADMGSHRFHGLDKPVQVWRVLGESLSSLRFEAHRTRMFECVGRDAELRTLRECWNTACRGQGSIVAVRGEAGIGKSRLLRAAADQFGRASGRVVLLQCSPNQATTPLHPVLSWIRREASLAPGNAPANLERLAAWLGDTGNRLELALVAEFVDVPVPPSDALPPMASDRKRNLTREVLVRHLARHCESAPLLFILEDAHWMDGATEDFLGLLFRQMRDARFMALVTSRPPEQREWSGAGAVTEIRLEPLQSKDAERLIRHVCQGRNLPPAVVDLILARTDGVPLFIEELTATVLESATAGREGTSPGMESVQPPTDIPTTLRDSLTARLDRLGSARDVARVASALGREFTFQLLLRVSGQSPAALAAALDRLVEAQLLFQRGTVPASEYAFKHALIQQAAYERQLRDDRHALHARIVLAIETYQPELASHEPGLMAHHCHEAGLPGKEVDYLHAAGVASTRMVAIAEALSYFSRAQEVVARLEPTPHNVSRHIRIILGLMEVGRFAILPRRLMELGALARRLATTEGVDCDPATMSAILFQEGRAHLYTSGYAQAGRIFSEIRQLGRARRSPEIEMKPGSALSMNLCCQGLFKQTLEFVDARTIDQYKAAGSLIDYIAGLGWISYASCQLGGDDGLRFGHLSVREAEQVQSPVYLGGAYVWRSHALMAVRRFEEAVDDARRCVELSRPASVPYLAWHGLVFLALCLCRAGKPDEAMEALQQARALLVRVSEGQWSLLDYLPAIEAEVACFRGDDARAAVAADQAIALASAVDGFFAEAIGWRVRAIVALRAGAGLAQARVPFERALRLYERGGARAEQAFATLVWSHALHLAGHREAAREAVAAAREQARDHGLALERCEHGAGVML
jgi:class 3 adenylate cyclase/tetratricopeptide (TPR) repeat protein